MRSYDFSYPTTSGRDDDDDDADDTNTALGDRSQSNGAAHTSATSVLHAGPVHERPAGPLQQCTHHRTFALKFNLNEHLPSGQWPVATRKSLCSTGTTDRLLGAHKLS